MENGTDQVEDNYNVYLKLGLVHMSEFFADNVGTKCVSPHKQLNLRHSHTKQQISSSVDSLKCPQNLGNERHQMIGETMANTTCLKKGQSTTTSTNSDVNGDTCNSETLLFKHKLQKRAVVLLSTIVVKRYAGVMEK